MFAYTRETYISSVGAKQITRFEVLLEFCELVLQILNFLAPTEGNACFASVYKHCQT